MKFIRSKSFGNGLVFALETEDKYPVEVTDTHLPYYTKDAVNRKQNLLNKQSPDIYGDRTQRWMIGVSCMSGCVVGCRFCATGQLKKTRMLTSEEIVQQFDFVRRQHPFHSFAAAKEHKVNYTRMGEPFLNIDNVRGAIENIESLVPNTHHYVSTIGIKGSDFSWIRDNITLQISLHSLDDDRRNELIPFHNKMSIEELGQIRTQSNLKTTVNLTLVDMKDFDIRKLQRYFDPAAFFIKLSPINPNCVSEINQLGHGVIEGKNF